MNFIRKHKWLAASLVLLLPIFGFIGVVVVTGVQCYRTATDSAAGFSRTTRSSENEVAKAASPDAIGVYSVPLGCPLVRGLGCGSESKPILQQLENDPAVVGAWLNHPGTSLAVVWKEGTADNKRSAALASAFHGYPSPRNLSGEERQIALQDFLSGTDWYRTDALDELSTQEAEIVARQWVSKISAIIPLPRAMRERLHCFLSEKMRDRFVAD